MNIEKVNDKNVKKKHNRFKFQNFAERISNIKIDVYHNVGSKEHEVPQNDKDTFFRENLERWTELNCSLHFTLFYREIKRYVQSFNQLIFHKETVVTIIKKYLTLEFPLALEPCLDLVATLSKDLLIDFCPYFEEIFIILTGFLATNDTVLIENTFRSLAHIFKFIGRYLVADLENVFKIFKVLLSSQQKQHIQNFAAESFAFLVRKSKNKEKILRFLFSQVASEPPLANGIGMLVFHTIKGVKEHLHSCAEDVLKYCLEIMNELVQEEVFSVLTKVWSMSLYQVTKKHSIILYDTVINQINKSVDTHILHFMLSLLDNCVGFKNGAYIPDQKTIAIIIEKHISSKNQNLITSLLKLCRSLMTIQLCTLTNNDISSIFTSVLSSVSININTKLSFCLEIIKWEKFDELCLSSILYFLAQGITTNMSEVLDFSVQLTYRDEDMFTRPYSCASFNLFSFPCLSNIAVTDILAKKLDEITWENDLEMIWSIIVCFSACGRNENSKLIKFCEVTRYWISSNIIQLTCQHLFVISSLVNCILTISKDDHQKLISFDWLITLLRSYPSNIHVVDCFEHYSSLSCSFKNFDTCQKESLYNLIKVNLNSPYRKLRLLTLMILRNLYGEGNTNKEEVSTSLDVFEVCINAENIEATFHNYREKLLYFQRMMYSSVSSLPSMHHDVIVRILIGNLFTNLSVLWDQLIVIIASFAENDNEEFWHTWKDIFLASSQNNESPCIQNSMTLNSVFEKYFKLSKSSDVRADYKNFRILLLNAMTKFAPLVERKSRDVVPIFFEFIQKEYTSSDEVLSQKQDLRKEVAQFKLPNEDTNEFLMNKVDRKTKIKTLCAYLNLFKLFKHPRGLVKEPKIYQLYLDFLISKDNEIQSLTIDCLMTYKFRYLKPYAENFKKLMNDATFRDELLLFSTDKENEVLKEEHRSDLMPILIRLLYGKLLRKSGLGASGKSKSARRNVIMQFLSNCSKSEIQTFIDIIMEPFKQYQEFDIANCVELDISSVIPLRRQAGFLNMLSDVVNRLDKLAKPFLPLLFDNLLSIIWMSCTCLNVYKDQIDPSYLGRIKSLRHGGTTKLLEIFKRLVDFQYDEYLEKIFSGVIWPQISLLSIECTQNVTPLFRLIMVLSEHRRYHPLLHIASKEHQSLLTHTFNILKQKSISYIIEKNIMKIALNLLSTEDYINNDKNDEKPLAQEYVKNFDCNKPFGIQIVQPFVPIIIKHVGEKLIEKTKDLNIKTKQKFSKFLPEIQLAVLSKISMLVNDESICNSIVEVLFPILQCVSSEDTQVFIITSLKNMVVNVSCVQQYLSKFPFLFHSVTCRKARQMLCDFYHDLALKSNEMVNLSQLIQDLNSWDKKRLEEPDFDRRLDAFRKIGEEISHWSVKEILPVLYNCLFFISTTDDMSIRDASNSCIQKIIHQSACHKMEMYNSIILKVLLPTIKQGLKSKKEAVRYEYLGILALLVKTYDKSCFSEMKLLWSEDPETCFFENMKHIQVHRRIRAVHQISKLCNEGKLSASTMFSFILPLISHNIFESLAVTKDHNLLSESISAIGSIMKCLPWAKYSMVLSNYLKLLRTDKHNQKTVTRVMIAILNNFHFDMNTETNKQAETILNVVSIKFLPRLQNFLKKKSKVSDFHKLSKNQKEDDEDIMKIPVTVAVVKLLQKLPVEILKVHLPGLLLRVSQSLRSHARDVRDIARDTLLNVCLSLGPSYLFMVFNEMRSVLLRGYQLHILGYTVHSLLVGMKDVLQSGDLDSCVKLVTAILIEQYFGNVSEEKEIAGITTKLHEAKSKKSIECIEILAKFISSSCIIEIISPLQEILIKSTNHKEIHSIEETLRLIAVGLHQNKGICVDDLLIFIYGLVSNTLVLLFSEDRSEKNEAKKENIKQDDIFLVPMTPCRSGKVPVISKHTNEHILVEFGLQLLQTALKQQKVLPSSEQHIKLLDPFVKILLNSTSSKYIRIVTLATRCLLYAIKYKLPSMDALIPEFAKCLFVILKKYARNCETKGDNFELVSVSFKAMTVLIRDTTVFKVTNSQLQILLSFVEEDIYNSSRQSTALILLKAILSRKITGNEVHDVMSKIKELSVRDHDETIRLLCRQLMMQYLLDYPLGKKMANFLNFYVSNLTYAEEMGRKSVLEMLASIFNNFPKPMLLEYNGFFFIPLVMMLANDESVTCRKMASAAIKLLLKKIESKNRDKLFKIALKWGGQEKKMLQQIFFQCIGMFVEVEKETFERRIESILPKIDDVLKSAVKNNEDSSDNDDEDNVNELSEDLIGDQLIYNTLTCLGKLFSVPNIFLGNTKYSASLVHIWDSVYELLLHKHAWIRLAASQMFTIYFSLYSPEQLILLKNEEYLSVELNKKIKILCSAFCTQLKDANLSQSVAEQATKNLIYLTKVVKLIDPWFNENKQNEIKLESLEDQKFITFKSLVKRMCQLASYESSRDPKNVIKRISVLRWIAALCLDGGIDFYLTDILKPVHREISSSLDQGQELHTLANEVMELFRSTIQKDLFASVYSKLQKKMSENRESRKRKIIEEAVSDPQKFAFRKQKFNLAKREQRKRKLLQRKPELMFKKIRSKSED
ncbi:small subunit processome component 20 homolog isoform X3 [Hydra vulgaris]|uniref:Small subunit processome component 20 homolog isoform X3 n=1 Tax=Hydra vulgaris TaxID=6087 RepID=A0ABM4B874_HYDVU